MRAMASQPTTAARAHTRRRRVPEGIPPPEFRYLEVLQFANTPLWSWGESNSRPLSGRRSRYDHPRDVARGRHPAGSGDPCTEVSVSSAGTFSGVRVLSFRQRSLHAVPHCFCCQAAVSRPRVPSPVAMFLTSPELSGGESEIVSLGVSLVAPFHESEQLGSHVRFPVPTSKPVSPVPRPLYRPGSAQW